VNAEAEATRLLREADIRVTVPRILIFGYLLSTKTHPTCEQIYNSLKDTNPSLSLASVYNVTDKLAEAKLIKQITAPDGTRHYDGVTKFHGHFYCLDCRNFFDISCKTADFLDELPGAEILNCEVTARGYCPKCAAASSGGKIRRNK